MFSIFTSEIVDLRSDFKFVQTFASYLFSIHDSLEEVEYFEETVKELLKRNKIWQIKLKKIIRKIISRTLTSAL